MKCFTAILGILSKLRVFIRQKIFSTTSLIFFRHADLMKQAYESPEIKTKTEKYEPVLEYLVEKTGCERKFGVISTIFQNIQSKVRYKNIISKFK